MFYFPPGRLYRAGIATSAMMVIDDISSGDGLDEMKEILPIQGWGEFLISLRFGLLHIMPFDSGSIFPSISASPVFVSGTRFRAFALIGITIFITARTRLVLSIHGSPFNFPGTTTGMVIILCHIHHLLSKTFIFILQKYAGFFVHYFPLPLSGNSPMNQQR